MRLIAIAIGVTSILPVGGVMQSRTDDNCSLRHHAKCAEVNLRGRNLRGFVLHHADLRGANLDYADLRGANLEHADLRGVSLRHAKLRGARVRGAKLHHRTDVRSLQAAPACSPDCQGADLSFADLTGAQLAGANLTYAKLTAAILPGANLRSANLSFANFTDAMLTGADFTGATNCASATPKGILDGEGCANDTAPVCYSFSPYSAVTGTFTVTGNTFIQTSNFSIPDNDTQITSLTVQASVGATGIPITSTGRTFTAAFSGSTTSTFAESLNGLQSPWSSSSGTTSRSRVWDVNDTAYGEVGSGRIRVTGGGSISTWASSPDQRIRVTFQITGTTRTAMPCA